ncbi:MAG: OmpP1/FadL family transporter [Pseudomonadota bacterium]
MKIKYLIGGAVLFALHTNAMASGYAISGKSTSNLGSAFSGTAVLAEDAGVAYTNPAAMQDLSGSHFSATMQSITSDLTFTDEGSSDAFGNPLSGPDSTSVDDPHYVPNLYLVTPLNEAVRFGFAIYAPYGLGLDYDDDWKGRYTTTGSDLQLVNFSPSLSFDASERLNLGFGIDFQYLNATLKNAVDYGAACFQLNNSNGFPTSGCATPQGEDGSQELTGSNWAVGYTLGLTYDLNEATRLGATFRSATRHDVDGESDFEGRPSEFDGVPYIQDMFTDTDASLTLVVPESLNLGISHRLSPRLQLLADATWTRWSRYDELVVAFDDNTPTSRTEQNWENTWRLAVGGNYRLNDKWLLRAGYAHDPTPIPDAEHRSPRIPGTTRNWLALGGNVTLDQGLDLDLGLAYALPERYKIDTTDSSGHNLKGEFESEILYLSAQLNWKL